MSEKAPLSPEQVEFAPAGAIPYEGSALRGPDIREGPNEGSQATEYAQDIFPDANFSYLGAGRYGVVLADETGLAYKVYRNALHYSRYEKEAGALQVLSEAGIAPQMHLLVDASEEYRLDVKSYDYTKFGFGDVQIPRHNSGRELPILVMDRVDEAPLNTAEPAKFADGFCKAAEVFMRENVRSWDSEFVVDQKTGDVVLIDVGELYQEPFDRDTASPEAIQQHDRKILDSLVMDFGLSSQGQQIQAAYEQSGLEGVRELLAQN